MTEPLKRKPLTLGPGRLTLGQVGTDLDMSCQLTNLAVSWEADSEDAEPTLCGDSIAGARKYAATLAGAAFQDVEINGVIDWTWKHKGTEVPFKFVPDTAGKALVTGTVMIDPLTIGGDVATRNKSEFEWACVGHPIFEPDSTEGALSTDVGAMG